MAPKTRPRAKVKDIIWNTWRVKPIENLPTRLHPCYLTNLDAASAYSEVSAIFATRARAEGLQREDVIADITSGLKPLAAGMIVAALGVGGAIEYVESVRDIHGEPVHGKLRVVLVDMTFYLSRIESSSSSAAPTPDA